MDIRQLRYFIAIVVEGSITAAAAKLNMSQPPLSAQLKQLESELGTTLFERKNKKLFLTSEGKILYERAKILSHIFDQTENYFMELKDGVTGTLNIGCIASLAILFFPSLIKSFLQEYPKFDLQMHENNTAGLLHLLDERLIELCMIKSDFDKTKYNCLCINSLLEEQNDSLAVVGLTDLLEETPSDEYEFKNLSGKPLIVQRSFENYVRAFASELHFEPKIISSLENVMTSLNWCLNGLGVSIMPYSATKLSTLLKHGDELCIKRLIKPGLSINTYLVWNKEHVLSPAAQRFIEFLSNQMYRDGNSDYHA